MKLTDLFTSDKQIMDSGKAQAGSAQNNGVVNRQLPSFTPGQTLQGELVAKNGGEVQIKLSEDLTIRARVDQNMNLEVGKTMTFEVKNSGHTLTLSPLFENVATDANVLKALGMASLPINESTIAMTEQLMKAGLSIDRNSLHQIFRESNLFPGANIADIIDLHTMSMTVNEGNLEQMAAYKNLTHQLTNGLANCLESIPGVLQDMLQSGNVEGAARLYQELLNMISGLTGEEAGEMPISGETQALNTQSDSGTVLLQGGNGPITTEGNMLSQIAGQDGNSAEQIGQTLNQNGTMETLGGVRSGDVLLQMLHSGEDAPEQLQHAMQNAGQVVGEGSNPASVMQNETVQLSGADALLQQLNSVLEQHPRADMYQDITTQLAQLAQGNNSMEAVTEAFHKLLSQGLHNQDNALLRSVLGNKDLQSLVKDNLQKLWTIRPEEVADAGKVEELYRRLDKQLKSLVQTLESSGQTESEAYRATTNLTRNLDFLQQLNQTYAYVQLPLRLQQGKHAHGELFVYTNKKHMAAKDGKVSALLHLDMENLGPVDVYVAMQNERVNTKFYVKDDSLLDFLEAHMDILTQRLKKRGYDCSCEMQLRNTESTQESLPVQVLKKDNQMPLAQYAFDVRT